MKFRCNKNSILNEISTAQGIISSRNNLSILSNVLLEAGNGSLCIKATDLKIGFETVIPVDVEEPGSTTVFCDKLLGVLRTFPEGDVIFTLEGDNFIIDSECEDSNVKLKVIDSSKFPELIETEQDKYFEIAQADFLDMINNTSFAVSNDEKKFFMNGVFLEKGEDTLNMVATDGRRLSVIRKKTDIQNDFRNVIIPVKIFGIIKKLASGEGNMKIAVTEKCFFAEFDNNKIYTTLIDGVFPNYSKAIPTDQKFTAVISRNTFSNALSRVSVFAEQKSKKIFFNFSQDSLLITSEESDIGEAKVKMECGYRGDDIRIAVNYVHFAEPIKAMKEEDVSIRFSSTNTALTLNSVPEGDFLHVIMPMQQL